MPTDRLNGSSHDPIHILEILGNAIAGGMEHYVRNLIRTLPSDYFQFTCLSPFESPYTTSLRELGCTVYTTPIEDNPRWRSIQFAAELVRRDGINLIHAHLSKAHALAGVVGNITATPVIATLHGMDIETRELGIHRTTGSHLIVVCQEAYSRCLAIGITPERVTLIPNGVDLDRFTPNQADNTFRTTLNIPMDHPLVGFVGRLAWEKGPDQFVRAAKYVHEQCADVHFVLIGTGPEEKEVKDTIEKLELAHRVHIAGSWDNMWDVYPALDVLVQTSRIDGMPLSLLEGMACGRPIVAMDVGGINELVEVDTTGLLVEAGDCAGAGAAILELLCSPDRLATMGDAARWRAERLFDLRNSVQRTAELLVQLAAPTHTAYQRRSVPVTTVISGNNASS